MKLEEAVKSGKPFRHKSWAVCSPWVKELGEFINCPVKQLISDDWEIQEKQTFTREDVERAIVQAHYLGKNGIEAKAACECAMEVAEKAAESCGNGSER